MFRSKSLIALAVLAVLVAAPLAHAQSGTSSTAAPSSSAPAAAKAKPAAKHATMMPKLDLNSASREDLVKMPGIGEAIADKIIAARPFKAKSELLSKNIVNKAQYAKLASHVIAKQEATAASTK